MLARRMRDGPAAVHVAAASLNQVVGDWTGNVARIVRAIDEARRRGAKLLVLPELCLSGYGLGDRVVRRGTAERSWEALLTVLPHTEGLVVLVGLPIRHREVLYNVVAVIGDRRIAGLVAKENLATGDVLYENRWYSGWRRGDVDEYAAPDGLMVPLGSLVFEAAGLGRIAVEVCEDGWLGNRPGSTAALAGATLVANPSASWFMVGKQATRRGLVEQTSREDHVAYLYASLMGCDDARTIFDGAVFIARDGRVLAEGDRFCFDSDFHLVDAEVDLDGLRQSRVEEGSWRERVAATRRGDRGPQPRLVTIEGVYDSRAVRAPTPLPWLAPTGRTADPSLAWIGTRGLALTDENCGSVELELGLCYGLHEYLRRAEIRGVVIGLSGGRDSAMTAAIAVRRVAWTRPDLSGDALRAEVARQVVTIWEPTENSGQPTCQAAEAIAKTLGTDHRVVDISGVFAEVRRLVEADAGRALSWDDPADDIVLQNAQARCRGTVAWTVANQRGFTLLTTGNLSEAAVGYTTLDGDSMGVIAPLAGLPKTWISVWLTWARGFHGWPAIDAVLAIPATAELRPPGAGQTDESDLMPYVVLDRLTFGFVEKGQTPRDLVETLWPELSAIYGGDKQHFKRDVRTFVRRFCAAQWKRERLAPGFRVGPYDLDPRGGWRWPVLQAAFEVELQALDLP